MILRADHVSGVAFVAIGIAVFALSGDLPMGRLSMPGAGFLPALVAALLIVLGLSLFLRAHESPPFGSIGWSDLNHAGPVIVIAAAAIALYTRLGFVISMVLLLMALLVLIERRNIVRAAIFSIAVVLGAFNLFSTFLKTPLPGGPFGF
jgi:putative tricarboxylic transport membrane protein